MKKVVTKKPVSVAVAKALIGSAVMGLTTMGYMQTAQASTFAEAMSAGDAKVDLRLRYESVEQDNALEDATALTLRTRLQYKTGAYEGFTGFVQMDDVTALGDEDYNSTVNGNGTYSVVADPEGTEVNQAYVAYGMDGTTVKFGRQEVVLDNARFIGNVGWRQNAQSYDALSVVNTSLEDTTIVYGYVTNVNRIFGESSANSDIDTQTHLINVSYSGLSAGKVTGYGYFIELDDAPTASNSTIGLRFAGGADLSEATKLMYTVEFATQSDYADGTGIDADYTLLEAAVKTSGVTAKLGYEVLGGDGTDAFDTPLATLHAFNGWTDQFLGTPTDGLVDTYVSVGGKVGGVKLMGVYHDYGADNGGDSYGSEINLLAAKKVGKNYTLVGKYGSYSSDGYKVDTDKLWLMGQATF